MNTNNKKAPSPTSSLGLDLLLKAGKDKEAEAQRIKSVAADPIPEVEQPLNKTEYPIITEVETTSSEKTVNPSQKKGIDILFAKRDAEEMEAVKISRDLHRELKVLAGLSSCTMAQMLGNIVEDFLSENQKMISSYKKKMI